MELKTGFLVTKKERDKKYFDIAVCDGRICDYCGDFYKFFKLLPNEEQELLNNFFSNFNGYFHDADVNRILFKYVDSKRNIKEGYPVIYADVTDIDGNKYGQEYLTEKYFPIPTETTGIFYLNESKQIKNAFRDEDTGEHIYRFHGIDKEFSPKYKGKNGHVYHSGMYMRNRYTDDMFYVYPDIEHRETGNDALKKGKLICYHIEMYYNYSHDNMNRIEVILVPYGYANQKEKYNYAEKCSTAHDEEVMNKRAKEINGMYVLNNIKDKDLISKTIEEKKNSAMLTLINNIEFSLATIKDIDNDLYQEFYDRYQEIIKKGTLAPTNKFESLGNLYKEIQDSISIGSDKERNISFFNKYIDKLFDDVKNEKYINISLEYLTYLHELLINNENNYEIDYIQQMNLRLNVLYFFYLYMNRDHIIIKKIEGSYIKDNIVGILNTIRKLVELGVIEKSDYLYQHADLLYNASNASLDDLLQLTSNIDFKDWDNVKELTK